MTALRRAPGVTAVRVGLRADGPSRLAAAFDAGWLNRNGTDGMNGAMRALLDERIPILAFEPEGDSLNDAFLALTEEAQP